MKNIIQTIVKRSLKNVRFILLLILVVFCLLETGCSTRLYQYSASSEAKNYPILKYKLIELIKDFPKSMPTTLKRVQSLFNDQLHLESKDKYTIFYVGGPFITQDGIVITDVDVRENPNNNNVIMIAFSIDQKQCVSTKVLKKKFDLYIVVPIFSHPVEHPPIKYARHLDKTSLAVGTTLDNADCATGISISKK